MSIGVIGVRRSAETISDLVLCTPYTPNHHGQHTSADDISAEIPSTDQPPPSRPVTKKIAATAENMNQTTLIVIIFHLNTDTNLQDLLGQ